MVSEAITAPGPNTVSHAAGLRFCNAAGTSGAPVTGKAFGRELMNRAEVVVEILAEARGGTIRNTLSRIEPPPERSERTSAVATEDQREGRRTKVKAVML